MEEQELKIAITTTADIAGVKKTTEALKDLGKADAAINEASTKATDRATAAKKQFGDAVKGVANQIPALGTAMRLVTNPIATSVALITASIGIIYKKLSAVDLSNVGLSKWGSVEINQAAESWKKYTAEVNAAIMPTAALAANLSQISNHMGLIDRLNQARKTENPLAAKASAELQGLEMRKQAASARAEAASLRADAAQTAPGSSAENDSATQLSIEEDSAKAASELAPLNAEIAALEDKYAPENAWQNALTPAVGFSLKYGITKSPDEVLAVLRSQVGGLQTRVTNAGKGRFRNETNAARRGAAAAMLARAAALDASAGGMENQAGQLGLSSQVSYIERLQSQGLTPPVTAGGSGISVKSEAMAYYKRAEADMVAMAKTWAAAIAAMKAQSEAAAARSQNAR